MAKFQQAIRFFRILSHIQPCRKQISFSPGKTKLFLSAVQCSFSNKSDDLELEENESSLQSLDKSRQNPFLTNFSETSDDHHLLEKNAPLNKMTVFESYQEIVKYINENKQLSRGNIMMLLYFIKNLEFPTRNMKMESLRNDFIKTSAFLKLAENIEKCLHTFSHKELLSVFNFLIFCNVSFSSQIFQKLLKLILDNFNKFEPLHILTFYLKIVTCKESNTYVRFVKLACLEYMAYCFGSKELGYEPIESIVYFAHKNCIPIFIRQKLLQKILDANLSSQDPKMYSKICFAISQLNLKEDSRIEKLMKTIQMEINENWSASDVESITKSLAVGCNMGRVPYREDFFDKMASVAVHNHYPIDHAIRMMKNLLILPHLNHSLLRYIVNDVFTSPDDDIMDFSEFDFYSLLVVLGKTYFHGMGDKNIQYYRDKLIAYSDLLNVDNIRNVQKVYLALYFAVLGIYNNDVIKSALSTYLKKTDSEGSDTMFWKWCALLLNQTLAVMHPSYDEPKLSVLNLAEMAQSIHSKVASYKWLDVVESSFGGENYFLRNCTTSLHHFLSYVVVLNEENRPVDLSPYKKEIASNSPFRIDQINIDPNYKVLIILEFSPGLNMYCKNVDLLLGLGVLYVKILEAMGYHVIHVQSEKFDELMEVERVPYFINLIEHKCGCLRLRGPPLEKNANS